VKIKDIECDDGMGFRTAVKHPFSETVWINGDVPESLKAGDLLYC
jgi:hypothetical protein